MPIDSNIALSVKPPQFESPLNLMNQYQELQGGQTANALRKLQLEDAQKTQADQNAADNAWRNSVNPQTGELDPSKLRTNFASSGIGSKIPGVEKTLAEIDKLHMEGQGKFAELVKNHLELARSHLEGVSTPDQYMQHMAYVMQDPVMRRYFASLGMSPEQAMAQAAGKLSQALQTPGGFEQLLSESKMGADKALEVATVNLGDRDIQYRKYGGRPVGEFTRGVDPSVVAGTPQITELRGADGKIYKVNTKQFPGSGAVAPGMPGVVGESEHQPLDVQLDIREQKRREAAYPKVTAALKESDADFDKVLSTATELLNHPGLSHVTGTLAGRTPNLSTNATNAQALINTIMAKGQFGALQQMRAASSTGGALGNVSDTEGKTLRDSFAVLQQSQGTEEYKRHLADFIEQVKAAKNRLHEAYDMEYEYKNPSGGGAAAPAAAPSAGWGAAKKVTG